MKTSFFAVLIMIILSTPLIVLGVINVMQVKPQYHSTTDFATAESKQQENPVILAEKPTPQEEKPLPPVKPQVKPSATFMSGYKDGWYGRWFGPIRWTISDDYRKGNTLGSFDRENGIDRYSITK